MPMTSGMQAQRLERLKRRYPFVYTRELTKTAGGRSICAVQLGLGDTKVLLTGGHHANEYITSMLCWELIEGYMEAVECGGSFGGKNAAALFENAMLYVVPMVNPDGIDLVTGAITPDEPEYRAARHCGGLSGAAVPVGLEGESAGRRSEPQLPGGMGTSKTDQGLAGLWRAGAARLSRRKAAGSAGDLGAGGIHLLHPAGAGACVPYAGERYLSYIRRSLPALRGRAGAGACGGVRICAGARAAGVCQCGLQGLVFGTLSPSGLYGRGGAGRKSAAAFPA